MKGKNAISCEIKLTLVTTTSIWGLFSFSWNGSTYGLVCMCVILVPLRNQVVQNFLNKLYFSSNQYRTERKKLLGSTSFSNAVLL